MPENLKELFQETGENSIASKDSKVFHWSSFESASPLPTPATLQEYEKVEPGSAKRFLEDYFRRMDCFIEELKHLDDSKKLEINATRDYKLKVIELERKYRNTLLVYNGVVLGVLLILAGLAVLFHQDKVAIGLIVVLALEVIRSAVRPPMLLE